MRMRPPPVRDTLHRLVVMFDESLFEWADDSLRDAPGAPAMSPIAGGVALATRSR